MILATPMTTPSQNNSSNVDIEEFVFSNLSVGSSFPHCYLSEALAPYYWNIVASPDPASNNTGVVGDSSFSTGTDISQSSVNHSPSYGRIKAEDGSFDSRLTSAESMDPNVRRRKKQKREEAKKKQKEERRAKLEAHLEEEGEGYIHVRARRGQATDSHSLAERVRRKKLSERMTILESLVPGCDKVTGKTQVLDVIINYVQSLQNQIEFLSMKLDSEDQCMLSQYSFDDQDHLKETQEISGMTHEQVMSYSYGGFQQQNLQNISEPLELDNTTTFSQKVGSAILGQFCEAGQGLLDQIGLDWITSFDF